MTARVSPTHLCAECGAEKPSSWRECSPECELYRTRRELSRALATLQATREKLEVVTVELEMRKEASGA